MTAREHNGLQMDADRLERSAQFLHSTTLSVGSIVVGAMGLDKVSPAIDVGDPARFALHAALGFLVVAGVAGARLILHLPATSEARDVLKHRLPLVDLGRFSLAPLSIAFWRGLQHWTFLIAILCTVASGVLTVRAEDLPGPPPAASH